MTMIGLLLRWSLVPCDLWLLYPLDVAVTVDPIDNIIIFPVDILLVVMNYASCDTFGAIEVRTFQRGNWNDEHAWNISTFMANDDAAHIIIFCTPSDQSSLVIEFLSPILDSIDRQICPGLVQTHIFEGNCKIDDCRIIVTDIRGSPCRTHIEGYRPNRNTIFHQHQWAHSFKSIRRISVDERKSFLHGATTDHQGKGSVESFWARNPLLLGTLTVTQPSWSSFHSEEKGTKYRQWSRMDTCDYGEEQDGQIYEHHSQSMIYLR